MSLHFSVELELEEGHPYSSSLNKGATAVTNLLYHFCLPETSQLRRRVARSSTPACVLFGS